MGRGLIIAFTISLALNLFGVGFISARFLSDNKPPLIQNAPRRFDNPFQLMRYADALPAESRTAFRAAIEAKLPSLRTESKEMIRLRRNFMQKMSQDSLDRDEFEKQAAAIRASQTRQLELFDEAVQAAFETLSAEERRILIEEAALADRRRLRRNFRRGAPPPPPPPPEE